MSRIAEIKADAAAMPIRDMGSFVAHSYPSEADLQDHRKQGGADAVFIGLQLPRRRHHRRRHHKHHRKDSLAKEDITDATPPSQRIQYILEDEDDEQHRAHDLFCEMTELMVSGNNDEVEWKETARWIKFEEDVEEGGERWSKPHVATLSLHSLFELRCSIMTGTVILDMDAYNLDQVTDIVLDNMIASKQLEENLRDQVHGAIMCRHKHQNEKRHRRDDSKMHLPLIRSLADIGKKYSEPKHLSLHGDQPHSRIGAKSTPNMQQLLGGGSNHNPTESGASVTQSPSSADIVESALHKRMIRKISSAVDIPSKYSFVRKSSSVGDIPIFFSKNRYASNWVCVTFILCTPLEATYTVATTYYMAVSQYRFMGFRLINH